MLLISGRFPKFIHMQQQRQCFSNFDSHWNHLKGLLKHRILGPTWNLKVSWSVRGKYYIPDKFSGDDIYAASLEVAL